MDKKYFILGFIVITVLFSCEERPCRKNMTNPSLGFVFFEYDSTGFTEKPVKTRINRVLSNGYSFIFNDTSSASLYTTSFRLPLFPDSLSMGIRIEFESVMRINELVSHEDSVQQIDTLFYTDTIPGNDSIFLKDTFKLVISYHDTTYYSNDTTYYKNFYHDLKVYYKPELRPVSLECGFLYEYYIDSVNCVSSVEEYLDTFLINLNSIKIPEKINDNEPYQIYIYF